MDRGAVLGQRELRSALIDLAEYGVVYLPSEAVAAAVSEQAFAWGFRVQIENHTRGEHVIWAVRDVSPPDGPGAIRELVGARSAILDAERDR